MANQLNAYELANQLDNVKYQNGSKPFEMYANMLRQQADRIAEFEKQGKPVAWMFQGAFDISTYVSFEKPNPDIYPNPTPLYTASQTKPLSDEEILNEWIGNDRNFYYFARAIEERHGIK